MLRALGSCGLGILFLIISPALRQSVMDGLDSLGKQIQMYSPFSYVGIAIAVLAVLMLCLYRAAQPRC
jgi:hypothetical protein